MRISPRRHGASLSELLAVMTLTGLTATLAGGICLAQLRLARNVAERAANADAVRVALTVLDGEARRITPADVRAAAADSVAMRSFRGIGVGCHVDAENIFVRYRGDRLPDSRKDSVLVTRGDGADQVRALLDVSGATAADCAARSGEVLLRLRLSGPVRDPAVFVVFESGSYYVTGRALRYRLGAEGRQPLTAELLLHPATRFGPINDRGIPIRLATRRGDTVHAEAPLGGW
jgi:hypothetical protein